MKVWFCEYCDIVKLQNAVNLKLLKISQAFFSVEKTQVTYQMAGANEDIIYSAMIVYHE